MQYQSIVIFEPASGFRARLTVGDLYRRFEVREIFKVDLAASKETLGETAREMMGTYNITFRGPDGSEYIISNAQNPSGMVVCLHLPSGKLGLVPGGLEQLAWKTMEADFEHQIA